MIMTSGIPFPYGEEGGKSVLTTELAAAQRELAAAQSFFECAESGQVDEAIFRVRAAEERINNLIRAYKRGEQVAPNSFYGPR